MHLSVEVEFNVPLARQQLMHDGKILTDAQRINDAGIKDHDMLMMQQVQAAFRPPASSQGGPLVIFASLFIFHE